MNFQTRLLRPLQTGFATLFLIGAFATTDSLATLFTPTQGQPGFVAGAAGPVHYSFFSPEGVPDTGGTLLMFSWGLVGVISLRSRLLRGRNRM